MIKKLFILLIFSFSASGFIVCQTTTIQGKVSCFNKNECCLECPLISVISKDSINISPDKSGNFKITTNKSSETFSIIFQSIGLLKIEIYDIPFINTVTFENVYLYNCAEITPRKYKRISRHLKRKFSNQKDYQKFMVDNFSEIVPIGGKKFYFDCSQAYPSSVINPVNNKKMIKIQPDNKKVIRLKYSDLIK